MKMKFEHKKAYNSFFIGQIENMVLEKISRSRVLRKRAEEAIELIKDLDAIVNTPYKELYETQLKLFKELKLPFDDELIFQLNVNKMRMDINKILNKKQKEKDEKVKP